VSDLKDIATQFDSVEIGQNYYLIIRKTGEVQSINEVAALFVELAQLGCSNHEIVTDISSELNVAPGQVASDLRFFVSHLTDSLSRKLETAPNIEGDASLQNTSQKINAFQAISGTENRITHYYRIDRLCIEVTYPSIDVATPTHSILQPMAIGEDIAYQTAPDHQLLIETGKEGYVLSIDKQASDYIAELDLIANYVRTALINLAGAQLDNWISIHAAGIMWLWCRLLG